ncbi:gfo/Idh/MocA family oxidoreductase [Xylanibacillus composti]|uniref:Dehydrogenase n=1 Tax=Xylanibacillus composti TaxID=1572762 RepID=A0A8J4M1F2_9BACL|nr:Gfo/Idh/MocA family oxidoreductase [Xylanibacillus composti]MDT9726050.1 gfo/Idh/MocA family oxidoreductase [Xylanibacillus composti]GIQ68805.1 hypothetical protein XYCOK13_16290 [Xylanibacillus composti]
MLNVIIVGAGWAGNLHAEAVCRHAGANLAAIVDQDEAKARDLSRRMGHVPVFGSAAQCMEAGIPFDAALLCTLPDTHVELAESLIRQGKHVLCEKPMGRASAPIAALIKLAQLNRVNVGVNFNQRFSPAIRELKARLDSDGTVHLAHASMHQHGPVHITDHTHEHFILTDACCHLLDTLMYLNGPIESVHAFGSKIASEIYSDVSVNLRFHNGSIGSMTHTFVGGLHESQHPFQRFDVSTGKARYTVENMLDSLTIYPHPDSFSQRWMPSVFRPRDYASTMLEAVSAWLDSVIGNKEAPVDLSCAMENARVAEACVQSLVQGKTVHV